ncbi:hypothetical protein [Levilactobacillus yiduensis]|uniref:hypothetical protein n=1 Tax=Levilactobacillus yiduensis TaxID=2953880 RepID=UPI000EF2BFF2|nr:hypothetical protein [Levilactobacillus yiduensis]AYM02496.1 hypothetical protein D8911_05590 [Levilactobacillus brevis]
MTTGGRNVLLWSVGGAAASWIAIAGAFDQLYLLIPNEPLTLALGLTLTVISLYGLVRSARRGPQWGLVPATVAIIAVIAGIVTDGSLLALGLTIPGFY